VAAIPSQAKISRLFVCPEMLDHTYAGQCLKFDVFQRRLLVFRETPDLSLRELDDVDRLTSLPSTRRLIAFALSVGRP
jgi:hypothetical protein